MSTNFNFNPNGTKGSKTDPITSIEEYMYLLSEFKLDDRDEKSTFNLADFVLFRGMPADYFELVGRIDYDRFMLRDREKYKIGIKGNLPSYFPKEPNIYREEIEKKLFISFKERARRFQNIEPKNDWEWMALARHYGVPNRVLDWTRDPQIALWFAVADEPSHRDEHGVIVLFEPKSKLIVYDNSKIFSKRDPDHVKYFTDDDPFSIKEIVLFKPPFLSERVDSQSSWFTVHPYISFEKGYKKIEENHPDYNVKKIYIDSKSKYKIRRQLKLFGINEATVYPDLDHTGTYLKNKFFKMSDEYFTDESLRPNSITKTFKRMQSNIGVYQSVEIDSLKFINMKGLYTQLITLLCNSANPVVRIYTYNNMNRAFAPYKRDREIFLRLIEQRLKNDPNDFDYKRIQVLVCEKGEKEKMDEIIFKSFFGLTDGLSKNHDDVCSKLKPGFSKYYVAYKNQPHDTCSFCIIELKTGDKYLSVEFNHELLDKIVDKSQNMCFWIKFRNDESIKEGVKKLLDIYDTEYEYFKLFDLYKLLFNDAFDTDKPRSEQNKGTSNEVEVNGLIITSEYLSTCKNKILSGYNEDNHDYIAIDISFVKPTTTPQNVVLLPLIDSKIEDSNGVVTEVGEISHYMLLRIFELVKRVVKFDRPINSLYGAGWVLLDERGETINFENYLEKNVDNIFYGFHTFYGEMAGKSDSKLRGGEKFIFKLLS